MLAEQLVPGVGVSIVGGVVAVGIVLWLSRKDLRWPGTNGYDPKKVSQETIQLLGKIHNELERMNTNMEKLDEKMAQQLIDHAVFAARQANGVKR